MSRILGFAFAAWMLAGPGCVAHVTTVEGPPPPVIVDAEGHGTTPGVATGGEGGPAVATGGEGNTTGGTVDATTQPGVATGGNLPPAGGTVDATTQPGVATGGNLPPAGGTVDATTQPGVATGGNLPPAGGTVDVTTPPATGGNLPPNPTQLGTPDISGTTGHAPAEGVTPPAGPVVGSANVPGRTDPAPSAGVPMPPCSTANARADCPSGMACILNENDGLLCRKACSTSADCTPTLQCVDVPALQGSFCVPR